MTSAIIPVGKFDVILEAGHIPSAYKPEKIIELLQKSYLALGCLLLSIIISNNYH